MSLLVFVEHHNGTPTPGSLGVLGKAIEVAGQLGTQAVAVVAGAGTAGLASTVAGYGPANVLYADEPRFADPVASPLVDVVSCAATAAGATHILASASVLAADVMGGVAARLGVGINTDGVDLRVDGGQLVHVRPALDDSVYVDCSWQGSTGDVVGVSLLRAGSFAAPEGGTASAPTEELRVTDSGRRAQQFHGVEQADTGGVDITQADVLIGGGRGLGGPENFHLVEELAKTLGGEVATTRAVVDAGWYDYSTQVGQTGKTVAPKLYIAVGISGAIQHKVGMQNSGTIIAINKDANAPIFEFADLGVVGDLFEVVPQLQQAIAARKG